MTSKQRAYLRKMSHDIDPIFQVGKGGVTPELSKSIGEALEKRELVKSTILKNCMEDVRDVAETIAGRTNSEVVQVMGRRFVLYKESSDNKQIVLPKF